MTDPPMENGHDDVRQLVREMIESGRTAEDVCRECPELITVVRRLWQRARTVEDQIDAFFPSSDGRSGSRSGVTADLTLPQIPGYDVQSVVGSGGMGVVYRAQHQSLKRIVAIKVPLAGIFATEAERQRHRREAQAVAALDHPNIVTVHDVGEFEGRPYFTMEFIEGQTLSAKLANIPQPARDAAAMVATLADAMHRAHQAGIIHRDLKPANILLTHDGTPKITDFGVAQRHDGDATLTSAGFQAGTPSYMSPEQADGRPEANSASVDIYTLGAILYEMLTGRPPFRAENAVETLRQVLQEEPASPSQLNPRTPRDLQTICLKCLRKEPQSRYSSAVALADDLRRFLKGEPIRARPVGPVERFCRWGQRRPAHAALIGVAVCGVVASVVIGFWVQDVQNARAAEVSLREGRARQAIDTAVELTTNLRASGRWIEARHVLDDAYAYLPDANSGNSTEAIDRAVKLLTAAWELDEIRRNYPESNESGFDYRPAIEAYRRVFNQLGLGTDVPIEAAANIVKSSPIRAELLISLDNAAFVARAINYRDGFLRPLAIARAADPHPWRDRFREPATWFDRDALLALHKDVHVSADPPPPHQVVLVGVLLSGLGANEKSIEILREAHELNPVDFWVNLELGNALSRAGQPAEAAQYFRSAVTIQPKNPGVWVTLGALLQRLGSREEAVIAVHHAIELNPRLLIAWRNYITYLRGLGRIDEAHAALREATETLPEKAESLEDLRTGLRLDRARSLASQSDWSQSLAEYQAVSPNGPNDAEFMFEVAAVSLLAGDHDAYARMCDAMVKDGKPKNLRMFLVARAVTLTPAPIDLVRTASDLSEHELLGKSTLSWSLTQRGAILCRSGRTAEAISLFEKSLATGPSAGRAITNGLWMAIANHELGKAEEAARWRAAAAVWLDTFGSAMPKNASALEIHLHDWLEAQVLRREVDGLLESAAKGVQSNHPKGDE